jgi:phosphoglycerate dehydrogenase-like enzyme
VRHGIGYDKVSVPAATARGVLAANTPDGPTEGTAEHAVGLMFALAKNIAFSDRVLHTEGNWAKAKLRGFELLGKTLGLVGFGRIGRRVAEMCGRGIRMDVLFYDPMAPQNMELPANVRRAATLDELLEQADVVSLHLGLDSRTYRLIGEAQLRAMKRTAMLINTSRGEVVDEAALVRVLNEGHLAGAAIDVFDPEPPAADHPLFAIDRVIVTPHTASGTIEASYRSSTGVVDQILQVLAGQRPTSLIDPAAWPGRVGTTMQKGDAHAG